MKQLSNDALWLWLALDELGLEELDDDDAGFREYLAADDEIWLASRLNTAIAELEELGLLCRNEESLQPPTIVQGTAAIKNGTLIHVGIKVFSATETQLTESEAESRAIDEIAESLIDSGRLLPAKTKRALYWCSTQDGDEDWFVVAPNAWLARSFHEDAEGYDAGYANAEWVVDVPDSLTTDSDPHTQWPSDALLQACGAEFLPFHPDMAPEKVALRRIMGVSPTAVRINGRIFVAGDVVENSFRRERKPGTDMDN